MANNGQTVHAANDSHIRPYHILACNGRAVSGFAQTGTPDMVTCKACQKALDNGKAVWTA